MTRTSAFALLRVVLFLVNGPNSIFPLLESTSRRLDLIRCASLLSRDEEPPGTSLVGSAFAAAFFRTTSSGVWNAELLA